MSVIPSIDVRNRLPKWLSPSAAEVYRKCPKEFYFKYILGIRTGGTIHTLRGTLTHTMFERIFDHPREERTVETALSYVRPALQVTLEPFAPLETVDCEVERRLREIEKRFEGVIDPESRAYARAVRDAEDAARILGEYDVDDLIAEIEKLVVNWFTMEDPTAFDPEGREVFLQARAAGVPLQGFLDRLDRVRLQDGSDAWIISDLKTGKVPDERYLAQKFFQLRVYAVLLRIVHGTTPRMLRLIYAKGGSKDAVKRLVVNDATLDSTEAELKALWRSITADAKRNRWEPKTQALCPWCDFQPVCPAFNPNAEGTLPEERELYEQVPAS